MKRSYISLATYSLLLLVSCTNESEVIQSVKESPKTFYATTESYNPQTKTSLNLSGNVLWKTGDQVSIFNVSTINQQYQVTDQSDGKTSASLYQVTTPGFVAGTDLPTNIAYYPYSASNEIAKIGSDYEITVSLPSTQNYAENSFGNGSFPMAAVTEDESDMNLKFKNVLGGLKLQLTGTDVISRIVVSGNNNEILCGDATVTASNTTTPTIVLSDDTKTTVTLNCGSGVQLNSQTPTLFIIALPPMIMTGGFTIDIYNTENGTQQIKSTRSQTITRSALLAMPAVAVACEPAAPPYEYVDLGLSVKWATFNVGATAPEESGDYYAWGETEPHYEAGYARENPQSHWKEGYSAGYDISNYKYCNGSSSTLTKYCNNSEMGDNGFTDSYTTLLPEDDVAHVKWGGEWRMPTKVEFIEMMDNCDWEKTTQNGVNGYKITSRKDSNRSIFLPSVGSRSGTSAYFTKWAGSYWSSSLYTSTYPNNAWSFGIGVNSYSTGKDFRELGKAVRPVYSSTPPMENVVKWIKLNTSKLRMSVGVEPIQITATPRDYNGDVIDATFEWSTSDNTVAVVTNDGMVNPVGAGSCTITVSADDAQSICFVTVLPPLSEASGYKNGYGYVDLGLSVKWATFNVGATAPGEYGDYFAWGETDTYYEAGYAQEYPQAHWKEGYSWNGYVWSRYKYCNGSQNTLTKYCNKSSYGYNGFTDNLTTLLPEDDVAHVKWGDDWRMPTWKECQELIDNCYWDLSIINGVKGYKVTSQNDLSRSIFLPEAGFLSSTGVHDVTISGTYSSSSLGYYPDENKNISIGSNGYKLEDLLREDCFTVRPVCP